MSVCKRTDNAGSHPYDPSCVRHKPAEAAMHANGAQLRETRDEWVEGARCTVRSHPLVSVAAAFVLGVLFARITR